MELSENDRNVLAASPDNTVPCSNEHIALLNNTKSYSAIASCVLEHIITTNNLNELEKLYYIYLDLKANYNLSKKSKRSAAIAAVVSARQLNINKCTIFRLQTALENKGYLSIQKGAGAYDINVFTPTLPKNVFDLLVNFPSRANPGTVKSTDCFRSYLDSDKMFIPLNYQQIDYLINTKDLTKLQKLIWLFFYVRSFIAKQSSEKKCTTTTIIELCETFKHSKSTIYKALANLNKFGFISKDRHDIKSEINEEIYDTKSVFFVEALFPLDAIESLLANQADRKKNENANPKMHDGLSANASRGIRKCVTDYPLMRHGLSANASHSNRNLTLKTFSNKNISNNVDVFVKNDDLDNTSDLSLNIKHNANNNLDAQSNLSCSDSKTNEDIEVGKLELKKIMQMLKGGTNVASKASNSTVNSLDSQTKARIAQELKEAQERRLNSILNVSNDTASQEQEISQENNVKNESKTLESTIFNVLSNVNNQENHEINTEATEEDNNWAFAVDIINEKFHQNVAKLTSEQVIKAMNFAKKLKKEAHNLPLLRNIDENELIKQFIHHAANFKMTKLRCATRNDEVNAALNFAFNAVKKGFWAQPADWGKAMELHLKREQLRYAFDADKEIFEFELELKKYLAVA